MLHTGMVARRASALWMRSVLVSCGSRTPHQSLASDDLGDLGDLEAVARPAADPRIVRVKLARRLGSPTTLSPCCLASSLLT